MNNLTEEIYFMPFNFKTIIKTGEVKIQKRNKIRDIYTKGTHLAIRTLLSTVT